MIPILGREFKKKKKDVSSCGGSQKNCELKLHVNVKVRDNDSLKAKMRLDIQFQPLP